jgi:uncharacterized protein (DUF58 family)
MNIKEVRKVVSALKSALFKNSNSYSIGMLKSHFKGSGLQFKEHQIYSHGDDVRFIDWKLSAKTQHIYLKTFEEERNVDILVLIDAGPTMLSGYKNVSKLQAAIEICCLLYLLAEESGDYVSVLFLRNGVNYIPKGRGEKGIIKLVAQLEKMGVINKDGKVNLEANVESLDQNILQKDINKYMGKSRELVILTDFVDFLEGQSLKRIVQNKNVHPFKIISPLDKMTKIPYSFFAKNYGSDKGSLRKIDNVTDVEFKSDNVYKKIKTLSVEDRFLESFIKEMM